MQKKTRKGIVITNTACFFQPPYTVQGNDPESGSGQATGNDAILAKAGHKKILTKLHAYVNLFPVKEIANCPAIQHITNSKKKGANISAAVRKYILIYPLK